MKLGENMRIDKFLAHATGCSRSDVKKFIKQKVVAIDGTIIRDAGTKVNTSKQIVTLFDEPIHYQVLVYLMMNKPQGYLSATSDLMDETVLDLLDESYLRYDLSVAGRLDKNTEGLLILTNDGQLIHEVITPKKEVYKKYLAQVEGNLSEIDCEKLESGVEILDGKNQAFTTKPAKVNVIGSGEVEIEICEGKFHQVKRMFAAVGCKVTYLKRLSIGGLYLDSELALGEYRELEEQEIKLLVSK